MLGQNRMGWIDKSGTGKENEFARQYQIINCHLIIKGHVGNPSKAQTTPVEVS